jgi:hypothetical protein
MFDLVKSYVSEFLDTKSVPRLLKIESALARDPAIHFTSRN